MTDPVNVLLLQGPPSSFARDLGKALQDCGANIWRINFCIGDWIYWHGKDTISYRGSLRKWNKFLENFIRRHRITDILYFADRVPYHRVAKSVAQEMGINTVSYEYGYLRPDWIVAEPGGQSAYSHFTRDLEKLRAVARAMKAPDLLRKYHYDFNHESRGDVIYHLSNYLLWFFYPRYRRDRVYNPIREYISYSRRFRRARKQAVAADRMVRDLCAGGEPYFVAILQMQNDYQIRENSPYTDQREYLGQVLTSFANHAPPDIKLVIKVHPLDNGIENWSAFLDQACIDQSLSERVVYLDGGDLEKLTEQSQGMITINSTSGLMALQKQRPLKVMGIAVFDIPGLTHQSPIDEFWTAAVPPERSDVSDFLTVLAHHCHVRGDFYGQKGREAATRDLAGRIASRQIWTEVFEETPPRLEQARSMGMVTDG